MSNERCKDHCDLVHVGQCSKETEVPSSLGNKMSNHIANPNAMKLATHASIAVFPCATCGCPRGIYCMKKNFPLEHVKWLLEDDSTGERKYISSIEENSSGVESYVTNSKPVAIT